MPNLRSLLEQGLALDAHYGNRDLASHLNMALLSLAAMGAGDEDLSDFAVAYGKRLRPLPAPRHTIDDSNWQALAGSYKDYAAYRGFFSARVRATSIEQVLDRYLPILSEQVVAGGFHGLLRVAYGIDCGRPDEIVAGLAYWADSFQRLDAQAFDGTKSSSPRILLDCLRSSGLGEKKSDDGLIAGVIARTAERPAFAPVRNWLLPDDHTVASLASAGAQIYLSQPDVLTLHLVTSAHALRVVAGKLSRKVALMSTYWQCFAAAYVAIGCPDLSQTPDIDPHVSEKRWEPLLGACHGFKNDHSIKLVYSCWQQWRHYRDPVFFAVARQKIDEETSTVAANIRLPT